MKGKQQTISPFESFIAALRSELPALGDLRRTFRARPTTFRVNTLKNNPESILDLCQRSGIKLKRVSWSKTAFILADAAKRELQALEAYERGEIYLQSLASQIPPLVLEPKPGDRVLDLCAAPGGKTAQIAALMNGEGELVAVEKDKIRAERLKFNLERQGVLAAPKLKTQVLVADAHTADVGGKFDKILIDAPCSGEARFIESDRDTWRHWSKEFVVELASLQRSLMQRAVSLLKPGGTLVYSTCTFSTLENELVVVEAIKQGFKAEGWPAGLKSVAQFPSALSFGGKNQVIGGRIRPNEEIEGFFVSRLTV